jgi:hypothetical protein
MTCLMCIIVTIALVKVMLLTLSHQILSACITRVMICGKRQMLSIIMHSHVTAGQPPVLRALGFSRHWQQQA